MKIRYAFIGFSTAMLLLFLCMIHTFSDESSPSIDMVHYNEQRIQIVEALEEGRERSIIEQEYSCNIFFCQDKNYDIYLQEALKSDALILDYIKDDSLQGKIVWKEKENQYVKLQKALQQQVFFVYLIFLLSGYLLLGYIYIRMIRPFRKLETFTKQVAKGNLDFVLPVEKKNYFGAYTESFDLMREELKRAKESEYQANISKKELIAELSHDIKTPVATIRATCEVMQLKEKDTEILRKVAVIDGKAKVIYELVENLFHATLEELTILEVEPVIESSLYLRDIFSEMKDVAEVNLIGKIPELLVYMDKLRLQQVIDNCLNNAWKYAGTPVEVSFQEQEDGIQIRIKDYGNGVPEEELALITEKFYRGSNAKGKDGSGLGLYLSKVFMEKMNGDMEYYNENGFVIQLFIRKV